VLYSSGLLQHVLFLKLEVSMAVTMKNAVFWDVTKCGSCMNRRLVGTCKLHHQRSVTHLLDITNEELRLLGCYAVWLL
jgi:hypothetical protein